MSTKLRRISNELDSVLDEWDDMFLTSVGVEPSERGAKKMSGNALAKTLKNMGIIDDTKFEVKKRPIGKGKQFDIKVTP